MNYTKGRNTKEFIIIHHTGSSKKTTFQNIIDFFTKNRYVSVHYIIGKNGDVEKMINENDIAWHCGFSRWGKYKNLNKNSIGIEVLSNGYIYTDDQRIAVIELCKEIMKRNNIQKANVLRHAQIAPSRKWDIGQNFFSVYGTWEDFQDMLVKDNLKLIIDKENRIFSQRARKINEALSELNAVTKYLCELKGKKFIPYIITKE